MSNVLSHVWNMSITGSIVILCVITVRFLIRKLPKIYSYALWSVVLFRLLCPVSFTAQISILEAVDPGISQSSYNASIVSYLPEDSGYDYYTDYVFVPAETLSGQEPIIPEPEQQLIMPPMHILSLVWSLGAGSLLLYSVVQYLLLKRKLVGSVKLSPGVYLTDHIGTAFVLGILRPRIYLPSGLPREERVFILAHERHHIRRGDPAVRLLFYLALCLHWFNPLVWAAFILAGKDMEMSCDEAVIKKLGPDIRPDYCASLLRLATRKRYLAGMPLAFGEGDTKGRILNIRKWRKPAKWLAAICIVLCAVVVLLCAFNPEEELTLEDQTLRTFDSPCSTGIGELFFTYPAGLSSQQRYVVDWTREEERLRSQGQFCRSQWHHYFIDQGTDFGGVVDFLVPEDREIRLEELKLPADWTGLDYISGSSGYPYAEGEYTLIKDGKDYIQMYLYTYSGRGYFLWFYTDRGDPEHKEAILNSVEMGGGGGGRYKTEYDEQVSLGLFNITVPKGYGYYHNETVILEITKRDFWGNQTLLGCVTAMRKPEIPIQSAEDLRPWVEALGIQLSSEGVSSGYHITDDGPYGDVQLVLETTKNGTTLTAENHYFFIAGDIVYDLWFDGRQMDDRTQEQILQSIWIKDGIRIPAENKWITSLGPTDVRIGELPEGYNVGYDGNQNIVFAWGNNAVGGVISYPIPEGLYDPYDRSFFWLEEMGIPDYEDESLIYTGGMTAGNSGWLAEFASDVPPGTPVTVHRRHTFYVVGDTVYDIWFDMLQISQNNRMQIESAIQLPQQAPAPSAERTEEDIAYEKTLAIMEAVSEGSCYILGTQENQGFEGPSGYERSYLYHENKYLYTSQVITQGENITDAGAYYNRYALLIVEDECFTNEGHQGEQGDIHWTTAEPVDPDVPWLGNRVWIKSFLTYMGTAEEDDGGVTYMWRYNKPYADSPEYSDSYLVNFRFDGDGNFRYVLIQVNLFQDNGFTVKETICSMDPEQIDSMISAEYVRATVP